MLQHVILDELFTRHIENGYFMYNENTSITTDFAFYFVCQQCKHLIDQLTVHNLLSWLMASLLLACSLVLFRFPHCSIHVPWRGHKQ